LSSKIEEKKKAFEALMRTSQGIAARAAINDALQHDKLLATAETIRMSPLQHHIKRPSLHNVKKELTLENM
jgi:hypothetical protein